MFFGIGAGFDVNALAEGAKLSAKIGFRLAKVVSHGIAGGVLQELQGGRFGHGFISAGGAQVAAPGIANIGEGSLGQAVARVAAASVVGGTLSEVTGGKFANGAVTGAFSQAFNDVATSGNESDVLFVDGAEGTQFADYFKGVTGMSIQDSISLYEAQTGETLTVSQVSRPEIS